MLRIWAHTRTHPHGIPDHGLKASLHWAAGERGRCQTTKTRTHAHTRAWVLCSSLFFSCGGFRLPLARRVSYHGKVDRPVPDSLPLSANHRTVSAFVALPCLWRLFVPSKIATTTPYVTRRARQVKLGCNEGWRKGCAQYVVLLGADDGAHGTPPPPSGGNPARSPAPRHHQHDTGSSSLATSPDGRGGGERPTTVLSPSRPSPTKPRGLLPDGEAAAGGGGGGDDGLPSPRWVLRPQTVAGGKGSLAQAVRALVDERRKSRAKSRSKLLPGARVCVCC